ncbi:heavy-metal-associated domain-containing protein [Carnobacterium funditum]|uniref:heavy-metal-associated domain-containing protein n=1 Tax=Carnobacterium funditum TaxID=2752 RepID=UPI00054EBA88|nr:heavy metal-associated domain-containing protein [Carnobacterium funditum]
MKKELVIEGMKCDGCANTVREKFEAIEGVQSVSIDLANKKAIIESQSAIRKEIFVSALSETKYDVLT